jgi:hypothetical protein
MNVIRYFSQRACLVSAFVLLVGQASFSSAQTLLVDFGNNAPHYRGVPVTNPDPKSHYWNSIQPGLFTTDMVDMQNHPTSIDLGWATPVGTDSFNGPYGDATGGGIDPLVDPDGSAAILAQQADQTFIDETALGNLGVKQAAFDYAASPPFNTVIPDPAHPGQNIATGYKTRFTLEGLDPAKTYDLTFFGSHIYTTDAATTYSAFSDFYCTQLLGTANLNVRDPNVFTTWNDHETVTITGLTPNADHILFIQFVGAGGHDGYLNSLQIVANAGATVPGDYNGDTKVNAADYTIWRDTFGSNTDLRANGDNTLASMNVIDQADFLFWKSHFTAGGSGGFGTSGVPEPSSIALGILAGVGLAFFARRR